MTKSVLASSFISVLLCAVGCDPGNSERDAGSDAEVAADTGGIVDATGEDGGSPEDCVGTWVGHVSGQVLDIHGAPPTLPAVYTICGNACLFRELSEDGSFDDDINFCYRSGEPLPRPVFIYHGLGRYSDLYYDFIPPGTTRIDEFHFDGLYVAPVAEMSTLTVDLEADQLLSDGEGFELSYEAGAIEPAALREEIGVLEMPADRYPPHDGAASLIALYAIFPDDSLFHTPATVRFPNHDGLAPGTAVEIMGLGNVESGEPYAGTFGRVAVGRVDPEGTAIVLDEGEGLSTLTWLGYRAL